MSEIKLSILIPTKDRYEYLIPVVRYFERFSGAYSFELIIEDNSFCNRKWVEAAADGDFLSELRYFHTPEPRNIVANCDAACARASGIYSIMLGDDDFVTLDIFKSVDFCHGAGLDSACFPLAWFHWADLIALVPGLPSLSISKSASQTVKELDANEELTKLLQTQRYNLELIAKVYQGLVKTSVMQRCHQKYGTYFPGYSPDIGNAAGICQDIGKHAYLPMYAVVAGFGGKSAGGLGAQKRHVAKIEDVDFLPKDLLEAWPKKIPYFWTGGTIWAASVLYVASKIPEDWLTGNFSFSRFYGYMLSSHPKIFLEWLANKNPNLWFLTCIGCVQIFVDKFRSRHRVKSKMISLGVAGPSVHDAALALEDLNQVLIEATFEDKK
tara:strand:+ start:7507 stop:8652 length:1146 start_codon:yes stop_codon:yes gene_type:complete